MEHQLLSIHLDADTPSASSAEQWTIALEQGKVLHVPAMPFSLRSEEISMLDPVYATKGRKNISLNPDATSLIGVDPASPAHPVLFGLVDRYARQARQWINALFPHYRNVIKPAPTSLRLHKVEFRNSSWRKDDSRLHVDAFPSRPNHGERILRVFMNINPQTSPRVWRVGEPFEQVARHFLPRVPRQWPGTAWLQHRLGITKRQRSAYDHFMLNLHDAMKADLDYQQHCQQISVDFAPGAGWICFSDQASHAVMSGQFMLEQTFFLAIADMKDPACAPLSILQKLSRPSAGAGKQA